MSVITPGAAPRLIALAGLVLAATTTVAAAQNAPVSENPPVTLAAGYQFQHVDNTNMAKGAFVDLSLGRGSIEAVLHAGASSRAYTNVGRHTPPGVSQTTEATMRLSRVMGGIRLRARGYAVSPFVHALGGWMRRGRDGTSTTTGPTGTQTSSFDVSTSEGVLQVGVGLDFRLSTLLGLRVGADHIRVLTDGEDHVWLATAGLSFGLGRR